ncbi:MAG: electron transfer flavoprotein subunit alpha/FixB family protein [Haloplanus sp.]
MTLDPGEHTVDELEAALGGVEDADELDAILDAEREGKDRKTAKAAIEKRLVAVREADDETEGGDGETEGDADATGDDESGDGGAEAEDDGLVEPTADKRHVRAIDGEYRDMWIFCETQQGELLDVSKEMLGKARELMDTYNEDYDEDEKVVAVLIGDDVDDLAEEAIAYGADVAIYHEDGRLSRFLHDPYTEVFCDMCRGADHPFNHEGAVAYDWLDYDEPRYTVFPATNNGRDLSALVQAELDSGLASDCSDLFIEDALITNPAKTGEPGTKKEFERVFHMKRPDFSGFEYSTILCLDKPDRDFHPQGASVIPGSFDLPDPDYEREGEVVAHEMPLEEEWLSVQVEEYDQLEGGVDLTDNDVVVALGRGIGDDPTEGIELGLDLVDAFEEADLGLSRGVITASYEFESHVEQYVTEERQIGESGQEIQPDLYVAAGISGAIQHKVGCDESDTILAINEDPDADIRDWSDYFVEGDLFEVLPILTDALEAGELDVEAVADGGVADD